MHFMLNFLLPNKVDQKQHEENLYLQQTEQALDTNFKFWPLNHLFLVPKSYQLSK